MTELKKSGRYYPYIMRDFFTIAGILFLLWIFLQLYEIEYENLNLGVNICNLLPVLCVTLLLVSVAMVAIVKMKS